jgi:hypothetical protein
MSKIFIISCSGSKKMTEGSPSSLEALSFHNELGTARAEILSLYINPIDFNQTIPAKKLYTGLVYREISNPAWENGASNNIYIVSALFGLIRPNDMIPYYNLQMGDKFNNITVSRFWKKQNVLDNVIKKILQKDSFIIGLSANYRRSFRDLNAIPHELHTSKNRGRDLGKRINQYFLNDYR